MGLRAPRCSVCGREVRGLSDAQHVDDTRLRRRFYDALKRAKLKRVRFHGLRHSFGTLAVQAFPLTDVKAYMGHADIATTMIYVHHVPQIDAADRLSRLIGQSDAPQVVPTLSTRQRGE